MENINGYRLTNLIHVTILGESDNCISHNAIYGRINEIKEDIMVEVTATATEQVAEYFKGKEVSPIRIFLNEGG